MIVIKVLKQGGRRDTFSFSYILACYNWLWQNSLEKRFTISNTCKFTGLMVATTTGTSERTIPVLRLCPLACVPCTPTASTSQRTALYVSYNEPTCITHLVPFASIYFRWDARVISMFDGRFGSRTLRALSEPTMGSVLGSRRPIWTSTLAWSQ